MQEPTIGKPDHRGRSEVNVHGCRFGVDTDELPELLSLRDKMTAAVRAAQGEKQPRRRPPLPHRRQPLQRPELFTASVATYTPPQRSPIGTQMIAGAPLNENFAGNEVPATPDDYGDNLVLADHRAGSRNSPVATSGRIC